ncbi:Smg-4/UPF3 family-domain-containing protein [Gilbertella persicaria]|uniref:Smg-4/UPF3 family-domain-containing protein n=1 Tax=Gilbertella persicaria TaxID=101096 RepID=UPI002220741F|nr:Smg-4/UPF3 family-domain-containing protein [Gilbertella persicaria]KAI8076536.1 Smg-4/UPF3 family-domain-containing protein [Gilbertella persicaria]
MSNITSTNTTTNVTPIDSNESTPAPTTTTKPTKTDKKKKPKKKSKKRTRKPTLKTKVVVRRLPPNLPQDIFMNSVKPWVHEDNVDYSLYVAGKLSKSKAKENIFSRAYFHFKTMDDVVAFHQGFDGHVFIDSRGNEYRAVVEFAPYQKVPREHKTVDTRQGTIDQDQDYLDFIESLNAEKNAATQEQQEPADGLSQIERLENRIAMVTAKTLAAEQANKPKTTPLLEHLRAQKAAQAAAKAKAAAKKNARRKAEKQAKKANESQQQQQQQQPQQQQPATTEKKKRVRNRKKEGDKQDDAKTRPPREPKSNNKPHETNKPKKSNNNKKQTDKPQVVKILGRQPPATSSSK